MTNMSKEQLEQLKAAMERQTEEIAKRKVSELDKTLDTVVEKLVAEGWALPAALPISAVNALGNTHELDDVNSFMKSFYSYDNYRNMKTMIKGITESKIKAGLVNQSETGDSFALHGL